MEAPLTPDFGSTIWMGVQAQDAIDVPTGLVPGGVVMFARNFDPDPVLGPARCHALIHGLQERWGQDVPLAMAIDQEGGPVSRLKAWVGETPSFRHIWTTTGVNGAEAWGRLWGEGLKLLGFNINFAPLVDLYDGIAGTGLGERRASEDPGEAAEAAEAFLRGLEAQGVKGCLKHFPGLGGTRVDSHRALPELTEAGVIARALEPFQRLARPDRLVMVAHVRTPWSEGLPASLHRAHVAGNPWGIQAAWVTDDLEMGGCGAWPWPERIRLALEAGHLALLVCQSQEALDSTVAALQVLPRELLAGAVLAGQGYRRTLEPWARGPFDALAWAAWVGRVQQAAG
jgi:beta-N-acetylhexosaminidase